jgi:hypothetical protein
MRKLILISALVLISASAQAGASRGLTLAANDPPAAADQPKAADAPAAESPKREVPNAETPKPVERPAAETTPEAPKADQLRPTPDKKAEKPRHRRESTEARVVYELHRHGIYW